jgi:hypothetical protein
MLAFDLANARRSPAQVRPEPAEASRIRDACDSVRVHAWNDPRANRLGRVTLEESIGELLGRGPGLTPAGDDALLGYLAARANRGIAATILWHSRHETTAPSRALLRWAARGHLPEVAANMLSALLRADGPTIAPALVRLTALGGTTGRAILTGLLAGLRGVSSSTPDASEVVQQ